ncbi:MAG: PH domain-containing protein [Saprospiraceae bacterium]|nr:PH domain-containing protein [Saprospiraceae bacterium]MCF8249831.1 PH domain-containing protein [Saprospiraceae bacterium]MCF8279499.1 PH domain-containing protein [Bacteroidales bacterium]MCF8311735.1 PH domain-containing protein [Saprospiraceae bacterium]MCF8440302.1 PH domain-containing protein [Saprospiraceae bacterium]
MIFENVQIPVAELPQAEGVQWMPLSPSYRTVEVIATCILFALFLLGWLVFYFVNPFKMPLLSWLMLTGWGAFFLLGIWVALKRFAAEGYALRQHDILHKHGVWWRSLTAIPFNRMQHCEISRGPVESAFGLATLRVFTAGGSGSDLSIGGLPVAEAERIKEFITGKIGGKAPQSELIDETEPIE